MENRTRKNKVIADPYAELEQGVHAALETYSNVHRGSGHYSMVSTHLYEQAREIVLEFLGLDKSRYTVIFCTPARAVAITAKIDAGKYQRVSSRDIGLPIGVEALAVIRKALPKGAPFQSGGGTTKLISRDWVIWAGAPDRFEAGTPAIINVIAIARALSMMHHSGKEIFLNPVTERLTAADILYHDELERYSGQELLDELRKTLSGRGVRVPTMEGTRPFINLDNSASTPSFTPVWNAFRLALRQPDQVKQEIIHEVKSICAGMLGAPAASYDVIFACNTTEAINLAAGSFSRESGGDTEPVVLNSLLEHSSNDLPWRMIPGSTLIRLPVDDEGFMDLNQLETLLGEYNQQGLHGKKRIRLVAVSGASNVLGICNNIAEISRIVHRHGAQLLVDAAQLVAHRRVDMEECGIDYLAFSAHKVYAPFGTGVLVVKKGLLRFNASELDLIRSSGEENIGGIAALGKALVLLQRIGMELIREEEQVLTGMVLRGMAKIPGLRIYGIKDPESPRFSSKIGVIVFGMKGMMSDRIAKELALQGGIGIRYGCHCAHMIVKHLLHVSPFLERFQRLMLILFPRLSLPGLARVSLGIGNSEADVDNLLRVLGKMSNKHKPSGSADDQAPSLPLAEVKKQVDDFIKVAARQVYSKPA